MPEMGSGVLFLGDFQNGFGFLLGFSLTATKNRAGYHLEKMSPTVHCPPLTAPGPPGATTPRAAAPGTSAASRRGSGEPEATSP